MAGWGRIGVMVGGVVLSLVSVTACSDQPAVPGRTLDRAALVRDIDTQLSINTVGKRLRAVLVLKDGRTVFDKYYGTTADQPWGVEEITQIVVSTLIGIAIHEGRITGTDATLAELLPDHRADMSPGVAATTLSQLLTMTAGFPATDRDEIWSYVTHKDPVGTILRRTDRTPFHAYQYSTHGAHLIAAVLAEATGMSVLDYARSRLFDPMDIDTRPAEQRVPSRAYLAGYAKSGFAWPVDSSGINLGWSLLKLRPADVAKIGQLYLDDGDWKGRQLVPASWVGRATSEQTLAQDIDSGYGFGWWVRGEDSEPAYYSWGYGGQLLEVFPNRHVVVVMSSVVDEASPGTDGPADLTFLVDHVILPAVER